MDERLQWFKQKLLQCSDTVIHTFIAGPQIKCTLIYLKGMVDRKVIQQDVLKTIINFDSSLSAEAFSNLIFDQLHVPVDNVKVLHSIDKALAGILGGNALLLVDGDERMLEIAVTAFEKRSIEEAPNESVIRGPREAFIENLDVNLSLMRRRLQTESFKSEVMKIGTETQTKVVVAYLQGICKQELVDEIKKRLSSIEFDGVLDTGYLEEFIEDNPYSPFPQIQYTERPDVAVASLLEGRVAVIVDGSPNAILAPVTFFMFMQAAEDYYQRYVAASWIRWIRYVFLFASLLLPSLYIAITTVHPEVIPERLLRTIAASREIVPFPALVEAFIMEIFFEALREAAVRIPKSVGQAVSIIGALIIGTAAVQAGIVSAVMVIIVSLTGISSFIIPHFDLGLSFRLLRFPMMILAGTFGLFGIVCGLILFYLHLIELSSFGVPYLSPIAPMRFSDLKDILVRAPWWRMRTRPGLSGSNRQRQPVYSRKWAKPPEEGD
ncbi:spore germination protein [Paenibacillus piri]|nr:spore germination protein [Paenibacillus piri]